MLAIKCVDGSRFIYIYKYVCAISLLDTIGYNVDRYRIHGWSKYIIFIGVGRYSHLGRKLT